MASSSIVCSGFKEAIAALRAMKPRAEEAMKAATADALAFLEEKAREILDREVYEKSRPAFAPELTHELYNSWYHEVVAIGNEVLGTLTNTSGHAMYLEWGTDSDGEGTHTITSQSEGALHWINPSTGEDMFAKFVTVHGIHALHFLERSFTENRRQIAMIYAIHLREALK